MLDILLDYWEHPLSLMRETLNVCSFLIYSDINTDSSSVQGCNCSDKCWNLIRLYFSNYSHHVRWPNVPIHKILYRITAQGLKEGKKKNLTLSHRHYLHHRVTEYKHLRVLAAEVFTHGNCYRMLFLFCFALNLNVTILAYWQFNSIYNLNRWHRFKVFLKINEKKKGTKSSAEIKWMRLKWSAPTF